MKLNPAKTGIIIALLLMGVALVANCPTGETKEIGYASASFTSSPADWNRTYGGAGGDFASRVIQTGNGGYALVGYTNSSGAGGFDLWLVKIDSSGNVEWNQTFGGASDDAGYSLVKTSDRGYAMVGFTNSFGAGKQDVWLVKTDATGNFQWSKTYGGANRDLGSDLVQTSDGRYVLVGHTFSFGAGKGDAWLIKTTGHTTWVVDDDQPADFSSIQAAINAAYKGDTVQVRAGTYCENVVLNKTLVLVGENPQNTIVSGNASVTLNITVDNATVTGFTIKGGTVTGIEVSSDYNNINGNTMTNNSIGLWVHKNYNNITENNMTANPNCGISLENAFFTRITGNLISGCKGTAIDFRYSGNNLLLENNINGSSSSFVILLAASSSYNVLTGNNLTGGSNAIIIQCDEGANNNEISGNNITGTNGNAMSGICLFSSSNNNISRNNVTHCWEGIGLHNLFGPSLNNTVSANCLTSNLQGIRLIRCLNNTISGNNITANSWYGIGILSSDNNAIYHNSLVDNSKQVENINDFGGNNSWDNGYPSGGNYWSDYVGVDLYKGPHQDVVGGDGIGDTPYVIDANNRDNYPLISPRITPSISDLRDLAIEAGTDLAYFVYADPHRMTRAVATYDVASGSIVYGMCLNAQNQDFDTDPLIVSQNPADRGRLLVYNKTVLMFGGPYPHWCVAYLEAQRLTPVYFQAESSQDGTLFKFIETSTGIAKVSRLASSIDFEHEDYFVIMALVDGNGNHVFVNYGFDWKGTWSAGIYLKAIYPNIQTYTNSYYIVHWLDTNGDGAPQPNEMTQI